MKILIVDDDTNSRIYLERVLKNSGYEVDSASDGMIAFEKVLSSMPDIIISDILMPEMDGFELCRKIKTDPLFKHIPFVFYTATYVDERDRQLAMSLGASRFLIKPMDIDNFIKELEEVIEEHKIGELYVPEEPLEELEKLDRLQLEAVTRKLNKKVKELENYKKHLEEIIKERTKALEETNKELEAFIYSVSHDLRAPLRAIDGFSEIFISDYGDSIDEKGRDIFSRIRINAQRMKQLLDKLLLLSRLSRKEMVFSVINMKDMVNGVYIELTNPELREKIDFQLGDISNINGDPVLMRQVWTNLISNAIKFSSKCEKPVIEIRSMEEGDRIVYSVKDNGAGFDMKYVDKLFKVFQRLHSENEFEGTGAGLAIVYRIIKRHNGDVWAEGEVGKGANFYFSLPK